MKFTPRRLIVVPLVALALVAGCSSGHSSSSEPSDTAPAPSPITRPSSPASSSTSAAPTTPTTKASTGPAKAAANSQPVHIQLKFDDGQTFGVGIPVIAMFSQEVVDATALQKATTVTINGQKRTGGRWYFEPLSGHPGYPIEGDYRMHDPWPAHSRIFVDIPAKGLSAGPGLGFDDSLTSTFSTGASHILTVSNARHTLTLTVDGQPKAHYPVSLGASNTPTARGIKVVMEKGLDIRMTGPGYDDPHVKFTQRLTYGGEYLHAAPWNCTSGPGCAGPGNNIGSANSSNGCTNLIPGDAEKLYNTLIIGDIVKYPDADGPLMTMGAGYGDWNVPWAQWLTGGAVNKI
jgi:lipoprotein-anchoring transpeptidase ErfK/SrfK